MLGIFARDRDRSATICALFESTVHYLKESLRMSWHSVMKTVRKSGETDVLFDWWKAVDKKVRQVKKSNGNN